MEQLAYYVNFHDKKSNGHSYKVFVNFEEIEEYIIQGNRVSIELVPIVGVNNETVLSDGSSINLEPYKGFESPVLSSRRNSHVKPPKCNVNSTGADYRA